MLIYAILCNNGYAISPKGGSLISGGDQTRESKPSFQYIHIYLFWQVYPSSTQFIFGNIILRNLQH